MAYANAPRLCPVPIAECECMSLYLRFDEGDGEDGHELEHFPTVDIESYVTWAFLDFMAHNNGELFVDAKVHRRGSMDLKHTRKKRFLRSSGLCLF